MAEMTDAQAPLTRTHVCGEQTGGRLAVVETRVVAGQEPPRHVHGNEDEVVYVLDGALTFEVGEERCRASAGSCMFLPRGIEHCYALESPAARLLFLLAPAGIERFFGELTGARDGMDAEHLITAAARYGVTITGPPASFGPADPQANRPTAPT